MLRPTLVIALALTLTRSSLAETPAPAAPGAKAPAPSPTTHPAPATPRANTPPAAPNTPVTPPTNIDKNGVVLVEQGGRTVALGIVLNGDGRILTALSRLSPGQTLVRYANGNTEAARIGHSDAARDLALLVPQSARWQKGLKAGQPIAPTTSHALTALSLGVNRTLTPVSLNAEGAADLSGHTVLRLARAPKPNELGGPLLDDKGEVVAILVSGCPAGTATCKEAPVALPLGEAKAFLRSRPAAAGFALPRLGVAGKSADTGVVRGLLITIIEPLSPAAALGLRAGNDPTTADLLVAVAGTPVTSEDALRAELTKHLPGDRIDLLVFGKDGYRVIGVRLAQPRTDSPAPAASSPQRPPQPVKPDSKVSSTPDRK